MLFRQPPTQYVMSLHLLYQDTACIAVVKPAGMLVHRSELSRHETVFLMQTLRRQIGRRVYPVHRLDRPTSGVMLFALDSEAARLLAQQFERHETEKHYWAVVRGWTDDSGCIDYPLKPTFDPLADRLADPDKAPQSALTRYQTLARCELPFASSVRHATSRYSWLWVQPQTGRQHQIRRHLKHIFHPIVGDTTYGDLRQNRAVAAFSGCSRLMLHARMLAFTSPDSGQRVQVHAPADQDWHTLCRLFGWQQYG